MYRDVCRLLSHWWSSDRIRVSPNEGRLLRIQPGDLLTVAGVDAEVIGRSRVTEQFLCLTCSTALGTAELHVPTPPHRGSFEWHIGGICRELTEHDIQVWQRCR